jgi:hypothetical protein
MTENPIKFFIQNDFSKVQSGQAALSLQELRYLIYSLQAVLPKENCCEDISSADILVTLHWTAWSHGHYTNGMEAYQAFCELTISIPRRNKILSKTRFTGKTPPKKYLDFGDPMSRMLQGMVVWGEIPKQAIIQTFTGKAREILAHPPRLGNVPVRSTSKSPNVIWNKVWLGPILTILGGCISLIGIPFLIVIILEGIQQPNPDDPYAVYVVTSCCPLPIVLIGLTLLVGGVLYWRKTRKATHSPP